MSTIEHDYALVCDLYELHLGPALFELEEMLPFAQRCERLW